jgi:hypothetical protein
MEKETQTKTINLLKELQNYFLSSGEIVEHNGIKKPDINLGFYMDIRDLLSEVEQERSKLQKNT